MLAFEIFTFLKIIYVQFSGNTYFDYKNGVPSFFFCWSSVHSQLVIEVFYGFLTYLQEIGLKGKKKKGKLNIFSWTWVGPFVLPLVSLLFVFARVPREC